MYEPKGFNYTLGILSLDCNNYNLRKTINSSEFLFLKHQKIVIVPQDHAEKSKELSHPSIQGGMCLTSMIDTLCHAAKTDWVYVVLSGTILTKGIDCKLSKYITSAKDIIFPVVNRVWNFVDGSINGLLINKNFHHEVGDMGFGKSIQLTKLIWADKAIQKGAKFKAIVGASNI